jgi:hypothetical protein
VIFPWVTRVADFDFSSVDCLLDDLINLAKITFRKFKTVRDGLGGGPSLNYGIEAGMLKNGINLLLFGERFKLFSGK